MFFWHVDEEIIALTVKRIVIEHRPQLIGFPIPGGIYLGPLIYYIISIIYLLAAMDPTRLYIFSAFFGVLTVFLVYKVGRVIFEDDEVGLVAAVLYGFSYLANVYSRLITGLTFVPILALSTYYLIYKAVQTGAKRYILGLGILILLSSQNEATSLSLVILVVLGFYFFKIRIKVRETFLILAAFLILQLPILIFDLRHNHFILKSFLNFLNLPRNDASSVLDFEFYYRSILFLPTTIARFLYTNGPKNIADQILPCRDLLEVRNNSIVYPLVIFSVFVLSFFIFSTFRKKAAVGQKIVFLHLAIIAAGIGLYNVFLQGYIFEWMLVVFLPAFSFILAFFLRNLRFKSRVRRAIVFVFLLVFVILNVRALIVTNSAFGLRDKADAVSWALEKVEGKPFALESIGPCYAQGYLYLFWQNGQMPIKSYADDMFSSTLMLNPGKLKPEIVVVMVNPSNVESEEFQKKYNKYLERVIEKDRFGKIQVLITD